MISLRNSLLSFGIGAAALMIIGAPAHSAVFDEPAASSAAALGAAQNGLATDVAREAAEPTARLRVAQGRPPASLPPGPPDWTGGKPPSVPPVSPRRPLG